LLPRGGIAAAGPSPRGHRHPIGRAKDCIAMSFIDIFAIIVLAFVALSTIALIVILGSLPGHFARERRHPHAQAVAIAGWVGLLFLPLWPLALIWAYVDVPRPPASRPGLQALPVPPELEVLRYRVDALEDALHAREAAE